MSNSGNNGASKGAPAAAEFTDEAFANRRAEAREAVNKLDRDVIKDQPEREAFFNSVYDRAGDDPAQIPWADLAPKPQLFNWLAENPGKGKTAIDIACGLGDNAEALAQVGYKTIGFDLSSTAINWTKQRFPETEVEYRAENLFDLPKDWQSGFDLVNECYTLQALPPDMLEKTASAIASLVAPGGQLLVYTRLRPDHVTPIGPPWPLREGDALQFSALGLVLESDMRFELKRQDKTIPHQFAVWRKSVD